MDKRGLDDPRFDRYFADVCENEDPQRVGFIDHATDPGGATYCGVTSRYQPAYYVRIRNAKTPEERMAIVRECLYMEYYLPSRAGELGAWIGFHVFDVAVLCGVGRAIELLQMVCNNHLTAGLLEDGRIGPKTLGYVQSLVRRGQERNLVGWYLQQVGGYLDKGNANSWGHGRRLTEVRNPYAGL